MVLEEDNIAELPQQDKQKEKKMLKGDKNNKRYVQPMLSTIWNASSDPTGWYLQEKFDGIRVVSKISYFLLYIL